MNTATLLYKVFKLGLPNSMLTYDMTQNWIHSDTLEYCNIPEDSYLCTHWHENIKLTQDLHIFLQCSLSERKDSYDSLWKGTEYAE